MITHTHFYALTLLVSMIYRSVYSVYPNELIKFIPFGLISLGIIRLGLFQKGRLFVGTVRNKGFFMSYGFFLLLLLVSYMRTYNASLSSLGTYTLPLQFLLLVFYTYLYFQYTFVSNTPLTLVVRRFLWLLILPSAIFIGIDLLLYFNGVHVEAKTLGEKEVPSVIASLLGLNLQRAHFLLGGNHNNFALLMGGAFLTAIFYRILCAKQPKQRLLSTVAAVIIGFGLLIADVRGVFLGLVMAFTCYYLMSKLRWSTLPLLLALVPASLLLIYPSLQELASSGGADFVSGLSRRGSAADVFTFNNRTYIWAGCLEFLKDFELAHLLGYGQAGHLTSKAYLEWAWFFPRTVTHNLYLQYILDTGYIGFASLIIVLLMTISESLRLWRMGVEEALIPTSYVIYFVFSGTFEPSIGIYNHPNTTFFLLLVLYTGLLRNHYLKQPKTLPAGSAPYHSSTEPQPLVV